MGGRGENRVMTVAEDREQQKREFIRLWVGTNGSVNQQERLEAGVLDFREVLAELDEELNLMLWQPLIDEGLRPFVRLAEEKFGHRGTGLDHQTMVTVRPARRANAWEWAGRKRAKGLLERALGRLRESEREEEGLAWAIHTPRVTLRRHEMTCANRLCAGVVVSNTGVSVKVHVGPFGFAREYAV